MKLAATTALLNSYGAFSTFVGMNPYISYRQPQMYHHMNDTGGPTIYWSKKNPSAYPKWITDEDNTPFCTEMTISEGIGDAWSARLIDGSISKYSTTELAKNIADSLVDLAADNL